MRLNASCEIDFESKSPVPAILMLRPRSGAGQWVSREEYSFTPHVPVIEYTDMFGNICQRVVIPQGSLKLAAHCTVDTSDTIDVNFDAAYISPEFLPETVIPFVIPSRYCPADQLGNLALEIVGGAPPGYAQVDAIRAWIQNNVEYKYGTSTAATTAADTAKCRVGVCRDFAHLGIALCRSLNIPARIVAGYTKDLNEPDLHAWFEAYVGGRWYVFDAVVGRPVGNRIAIAFGRDAADVAIVTQFGPLALKQLRVRVTPAGEE